MTCSFCQTAPLKKSPLGLEENAIVKSTLSDEYQIYAVASATFRLVNAQLVTCQPRSGALALAREHCSRDCYLLFVDLRDSPGFTFWRCLLDERVDLRESHKSPQPEQKSHYEFTEDRGPHPGAVADIWFVYEVEQARLCHKLAEVCCLCRPLRKSIAKKCHEVSMDSKDGDFDACFRRVDLNNGPHEEIEDARATLSSEKSRHVVGQLATLPRLHIDPTCASGDVSDLKDVAQNGILSLQCRPSYSVKASTEATNNRSSTASDVWTYTIHDKTYRIPDLTASLSSVHEAQESETKFRGGYGVVRRGQLRDGTIVGIKTLFTSSSVYLKPEDSGKEMKERKRFRNEAAMHSMFSHPNVLPLLGIAEPVAFGLGASLVLPWMKSKDSLTYVRENAQKRRLPLISGTISGVKYLHSEGVVHGDIKARNILISNEGVPLLCDFGLASFIETEDRALSKSLAAAGSLQWMAVELHMSDSPGQLVTCYSDMWAFGMVVIELLTGDYPFRDTNRGAMVFMRIFQRDLPPRPPSEECTDELWELVLSCWKEEPSARPTARDALHTIRSISSLSDPLIPCLHTLP